MSHSGKILLTLILFCFSSLEAGYQSEIESARGEGRGDTKEEAILNAKVNALQSFAEYFSVKGELVNDDFSEDIVFLSVGAVEDFEEISSYENDFGQTVVIIEAKLNRNSMQLIDLFGIDEDKATMNVNGSFYASENSKWRFNQKSEIKFLNHLLERVQVIGDKEGFIQAEFPLGKMPGPRSVGNSILQNRFYVDYYASNNMNAVFEVVRKTLRSLSVSREEYMTIPTREIFQVELCTDAMLFGNRFDEQKKKQRRRNQIPDCQYETFFLRNRQSIQMLQRIEDFVRSEIKATKVVRQYDDGSCKVIIHSRFDEKKHRGIKRIDNERRFNYCFNDASVKALKSKPLDKEKPYWPKISNWNGSNTESFSNNLTFNTCNVDFKGKERIFFPVSRQCRAQIPSCVIPSKNSFGDQENVAFGLNLPLGGELIARKEIVDNLRETDYLKLNMYKAQKDASCK